MTALIELPTHHAYARAITASKKARWAIEADVLRGRTLDASHKYLPDGLSFVTRLEFHGRQPDRWSAGSPCNRHHPCAAADNEPRWRRRSLRSHFWFGRYGRAFPRSMIASCRLRARLYVLITTLMRMVGTP